MQWIYWSHILLTLLPKNESLWVLCCGVLWCAVVCCAVLCCAVLWCAVVCCTAVVWCAVLWCALLWCGVVCYAVVWCGVVCCTVLYCTVTHVSLPWICQVSSSHLLRFPMKSVHLLWLQATFITTLWPECSALPSLTSLPLPYLFLFPFLFPFLFLLGVRDGAVSRRGVFSFLRWALITPNLLKLHLNSMLTSSFSESVMLFI